MSERPPGSAASAPPSTDSVARGGKAIVLARMIGMACSFLLFLLLARHSASEAGIFRTLVTYLLIAEFLGLLGTQRWLAVELAPPGPRRQALFAAGNALACGAGLLIAGSFVLIAASDLYGPDIGRGLCYAAAACLPAALLTQIQTTLMGIGKSSRMGLLNLAENLGRSSLSIALLFAGASALDIILVFVACRWLTALGGLLLIRRLLGPFLRPQGADLRLLLSQVPRFAWIMLAFLVMRNAGLILLPALTDAKETAIFAVPFQLFDLVLLVPTILALSSHYHFAFQATRGRGALRQALSRLWALTALYLLPLLMLAAVFGGDALAAVFGHRYDDSLPAFYLLMAATPLVALDQVLSQAQQAGKQFRADSVAISCGALAMILSTLLLGELWGATGAAASLLGAMALLVGLRLWQLRTLVSLPLLLRPALRPALLVLCLGGLLALLRLSLAGLPAALNDWAWLPLGALCLPLYLLLLRRSRALRPRQEARLRRFLQQRHEARSTEVPA